MPKYARNSAEYCALHRERALSALCALPQEDRRRVLEVFCPRCYLVLDKNHEAICLAQWVQEGKT